MNTKNNLIASEDPKESAKEAGLRYVMDDKPGITRIKKGSGFAYVDPRGKIIRTKDTLDRIYKMVIPPAWKDVWICPYPNGHLQATGVDDRGRKQYHYHDKWREVRDLTKYDHMISFGYALPKIRNRIRRDLTQKRLSKDKVLAGVLAVMEKTFIRVGNEEYAKSNNSYGLTTLHDKHVQIQGEHINFIFIGKSGVHHSILLDDPKLAKIIKQCQDLPGHELFQYLDDNGAVHDVKSDDVNDYLKRITNENFTAKDFRTWHGTVLAIKALKDYTVPTTKQEIKRNLVLAIASVADNLGNTRAVCKKCYIHPMVLESYESGRFVKQFVVRSKSPRIRALAKLHNDELAVVRFLNKNIRK